jgi:hypothetical protein
MIAPALHDHVHMLPLTADLILAGPLSGWLSDGCGAARSPCGWPYRELAYPPFALALFVSGGVRLQPVRRSEHDGHMKQLAGALSRCRLRHARDLPESCRFRSASSSRA